MSYRYHSTNLNTFAEVAELYNTVKPVVSKNHRREDDLRPIGVRTRKNERIIKVSDNKYILNDGECDPIPFWHGYNHNNATRLPTMKEVEALAPIVWSIDRKGNEVIKIRNGSGKGSHQTRYAFLQHTLPENMGLLIDSGKQYIQLIRHYNHEAEHKNFFLPKSEYNWKDGDSKDDGRQLYFTRPINHKNPHTPWSIKGNTFTFSPPRKRIDLERKARVKPLCDKFYEYILAMYPLVELKDSGWHWSVYQDKLSSLQEHFEIFSGTLVKEGNQHPYTHWDWDNKHDFVEHVLKKEDHPCRVVLLELFIIDSELHQIKVGNSHVPDDKLSSVIRNQWNRWVNKIFDLEYVHTKATIARVK
tara:strand:- start:27544 stop:28620 length:1077 start_codon:yes stop_codon:yes gene_type:complete